MSWLLIIGAILSGGLFGAGAMAAWIIHKSNKKMNL